MLNIRHSKFFPTLNKKLRLEKTRTRSVMVGGKFVGISCTDTDWSSIKMYCAQNRMYVNDLMSYIFLNNKLADGAKPSDVARALAEMIREREDREDDSSDIFD